MTIAHTTSGTESSIQFSKGDYVHTLTHFGRRVEAYIKDNKLENNSWYLYFTSLMIILGWMVSYYFAIIKGYRLMAVLLGVFHAQFGINISHDGNHGAFSKYSFLNSIASFMMDFMGASSLVWEHQHNIGHHPNSNRYIVSACRLLISFEEMALLARVNVRRSIQMHDLEFRW